MSVGPDRRQESGPFDVVGDVHGCTDELVELMDRLGYRVELTGSGEGRHARVTPPPGRRLIFVGDFVDRGPNPTDTLRIAMAMVAAGQALAVPGNHDDKLLRWLNGRNVTLSHGLDATVAALQAEPPSLRREVKSFFESLPYHLWLDGGRLVVAHAGIREHMLGRTGSAIRSFCLYGDTTGETDEYGLPVRRDWAAHYRGSPAIVYGHTPLAETGWRNNTVCLDTGCCYGNRLTAMRWPERELVSVPAARVYAEPKRPLGILPDVSND